MLHTYHRNVVVRIHWNYHLLPHELPIAAPSSATATSVCSSRPNRFGNPTAAPQPWPGQFNVQYKKEYNSPSDPYLQPQPNSHAHPHSSFLQSAIIHHPLSFFVFCPLRLGLAGGGSLLGLLAPQLGLVVGLDGQLGLADGGGTLDGGLAEVSAVAGLGDLGGNGLVGPKSHDGH